MCQCNIRWVYSWNVQKYWKLKKNDLRQLKNC